MGYLLSIDAGTTGVRCFVIDDAGGFVDVAYREFPQYFPQPGWVEHDATEILDAVYACMAEVRGRLPDDAAIAGIGITNQRETVVAWSQSSGKPLYRALVWQDRRTAAVCDGLAERLPVVRAKTGLVLDPYFSATKLAWLLREIEINDDVLVGTIDTWILWNLTGEYATDVSNASRTLLCDIGARQWDDELRDIFGVPVRLAEIRPSSGRFGVTADGIPVSGIAGDQQAALFGQACFTPGMTKNTYGTGSFVLMNVGDALPAPVDGLLTTIGWELSDGSIAYALEGAIFVTGAAIQWLRDGLQIISSAAEIGPLAASVDDTDGVFVVPAFTGLGSPWWDPYARGAIVGLTRGTSRAHIARAVVEAMVLSTRDVVDAMTAASGRGVTGLRVDGGASVMDLLCQMQADQLQVPVERPSMTETTALGAAYLAGLAEGVWSSTDEIASLWSVEAAFAPRSPKELADARLTQWHNAVARSRDWATEASTQ